MKNIALFKIYIESGAKCDFCSGPFLDEKIEGLRNIFTGEKYLICKKCIRIKSCTRSTPSGLNISAKTRPTPTGMVYLFSKQNETRHNFL